MPCPTRREYGYRENHNVTEEANETDEVGSDEAEWLRNLRKEAREAAKLRQQVNDLRRDKAMDEAGIPKTGAGKLFRKTWDGNPDDYEGLRAAAAEYELIPTDSNTSPDDSTVADAIDTAARISETTQPAASAPTVEALLGEAKTLKEIEEIARNAGIAASYA